MTRVCYMQGLQRRDVVKTGGGQVNFSLQPLISLDNICIVFKNLLFGQ